MYIQHLFIYFKFKKKIYGNVSSTLLFFFSKICSIENIWKVFW